MKTNYQTIFITTIIVIGLIPAVYYIHPIQDKSDLPNDVVINEFLPEKKDDIHKVVMPPVLLDATNTTSGLVIF